MFLVLNWKMNPETVREAKALLDETVRMAGKTRAMKMIVAPPALFLPLLKEHYRGRAVAFAVQNVHCEPSGPHTGEISARQARGAGAVYAIVGHAERRAAGETDDDVRKKVKATLAEGLIAVICIGEGVRDASGEYLEFVKKQLIAALSDVEKKQIKKIVVAYEPVWAIGATEPMRAVQMHEMTIFIRKILWEKYGRSGLAVPILYGGAILNGGAATELVKESEVNGLLLGRVSIDTEKLAELSAAFSKQ